MLFEILLCFLFIFLEIRISVFYRLQFYFFRSGWAVMNYLGNFSHLIFFSLLFFSPIWCWLAPPPSPSLPSSGSCLRCSLRDVSPTALSPWGGYVEPSSWITAHQTEAGSPLVGQPKSADTTALLLLGVTEARAEPKTSQTLKTPKNTNKQPLPRSTFLSESFMVQICHIECWPRLYVPFFSVWEKMF